MAQRLWKISIIPSFLFLLLLGACGGSSEESGQDNNQEGGGEDIVIDYWAAWDPGSQKAESSKEMINQYEEENPDITIDVQEINFDQMYDNLVTSINANDAPDISWGLGEWLGQFNGFGALMDLTDYVEDWEGSDQIPDNVLESLTIDGELKAVPNYLGNRGLVYNEKMLNESGIDEPPETWDELMDMDGQIEEATGKKAFGIAGAGERAPQELIMYLAQNDLELAAEMEGGMFKNTWQENSDEMERATEVFQFYKDMLDNGLINSNASAWTWQEEDTNFALGEYAMVINGPWIRDTINSEGAIDEDNVSVTSPPANEVEATFLEISPFYLYENTEHPDEVWEFAKFMLSEEFQSEVNTDDSPLSDVQGEDDWGQSFNELTEIGTAFPQVSLGGITNAMEDALAMVLVNDEDPQEAAEFLSEEINNTLQKNGEFSEE
ncbi:ABC transporter substrate-binding protein [Salibacterium aidingense]|uniref:ABC transporter substrate-binding protein n=1 Tax=Salibacterium aidingense TaxID=384933 RepID=UPI003BBB7DD4